MHPTIKSSGFTARPSNRPQPHGSSSGSTEAPITHQPITSMCGTSTTVEPPPPPPIGAPLEVLNGADMVNIDHMVEDMEVLYRKETANMYTIGTSAMPRCWMAFECTESPLKGTDDRGGGFTMAVKDAISHQDIFYCHRPFHGCADHCGGMCMCCRCCRLEMVISSPTLGQFAEISQRSSCGLRLMIKVADQPSIFINGPAVCGNCCCACCDRHFGIHKQGVGQIGQITKRFSDCAHETMTDADSFVVTFTQDLDVRCKAALIGATFLIDFHSFETETD